MFNVNKSMIGDWSKNIYLDLENIFFKDKQI